MRVIEVGEKYDFLPDNTVKGVELDGITDAIQLARCLGTYAVEQIEGRVQMPDLSSNLGAEALTVQAQLLKQIEMGGITNKPFSFKVQDGQAGRVLRGAITQHADRIDTTTWRPFFRFLPMLLAGVSRPVKSSKENFEISDSTINPDKHERSDFIQH